MRSKIQKNVIIYGGAFNPPTIAHLEIIKACLIIAQERDAEVWIIPSGDRRDKKISVPREKRLAFVDALISDAVGAVGGNCHIKTFELDRIVPTETIDSVNELYQQHPDKTFTFVFGADSTTTMLDWYSGDLLLNTLPMLVIPREGSLINPLAKKATILNIIPPQVSSTQVRNLIATGKSVAHLIPKSVMPFLIDEIY